MAGNDWINSYLEAILDAGGAAGEISAAAGGGGGIEGASGEKRDKSSLMLRERGRFSPARYFVEEVISGFDETDLYKTWVRTSAMRSPQERNTRLENMSWRIWNLARKKKQLWRRSRRRWLARAHAAAQAQARAALGACGAGSHGCQAQARAVTLRDGLPGTRGGLPGAGTHGAGPERARGCKDFVPEPDHPAFAFAPSSLN
ncbi:putative sucrose-phosphate synthase family protein [Panicum miliaceum]|uniref:Sucrose-phosphate synthase family protein n=1 Tax=Panicum miliaceum TaxID=4540 RepID=A0A3L6PRS3_PANMI|nr:putative sucrose-phosphate synthase family protein [Panicum miliaceum]